MLHLGTMNQYCCGSAISECVIEIDDREAPVTWLTETSGASPVRAICVWLAGEEGEEVSERVLLYPKPSHDDRLTF